MYNITEQARMDMLNGFLGRVMWVWDDAARAILDDQSYKGMSRTDMEKYVRCNIKDR